MKIHELEITDIRGIRHVTLKPDGNNFVIWGPNGAGKSAVVDAIDFLFRGCMARLEGEGTAGISTAKHGFHVDSNQSKASVRALISLDTVPGTFQVARSLSKPQVLEYPSDYADQLRPVLEVMDTGQYVLTRREILRLITSAGGDRAKSIQLLLRLGNLEELRAILVKTANEAKNQAKTSANSAAAEAAAAAKLLGMHIWDEKTAVEAVNVLRAELDGAPLTSLDPEGLKAGVAPQAASKSDLQAARLLEALSDVDRIQSETVPMLEAKINALAIAVGHLLDNVTALGLVKKLRLIEDGLEAIPADGRCPLCGAEWRPGELAERLTLELTELNESTKAKTEVDSAILAVSSSVEAVFASASRVQAEAMASGKATADSPIARWTSDLEAFIAALNRGVEDAASLALLRSPPPLVTPSDAALILDTLRLEAQVLSPQLTTSQKAWDVLTRLADSLSRLRGASAVAQAASVVRGRTDCLLHSFNDAKNAVFNTLYDAVTDRFVGLYSALHRDDGEEAFLAVLQQDDAAVKFLVDFYGRGLYPPHALHSEGHQDSMGVCLYLALAEYVTKGLVGVTVLDDVVMSIDAGHRKRLCKVLNSEFKSQQFIITTHDRSWAHQLRTEGFVSSRGITHFVGWSVEGGPRVGEGNPWKNIAARLEVDDVEGAAALLRSSMEEFFADVCERLGGAIVYRANGDYTLGDYLPAAYARYTSLLGKAKASANSWGEKALVAQLGEIESVARQCWERTNAEQWAANKGIHFDSWHRFGRADLAGVIEAFEDMWRVFTCTTCGSVLSVSTAGLIDVAVRCNCQAVNWNLVMNRPPK